MEFGDLCSAECSDPFYSYWRPKLETNRLYGQWKSDKMSYTLSWNLRLQRNGMCGGRWECKPVYLVNEFIPDCVLRSNCPKEVIQKDRLISKIDQVTSFCRKRDSFKKFLKNKKQNV